TGQELCIDQCSAHWLVTPQHPSLGGIEMMKWFALVALSIGLVQLAGCGSSNRGEVVSPPIPSPGGQTGYPPAPAVAITPSIAEVGTGKTQQFGATVDS